MGHRAGRTRAEDPHSRRRPQPGTAAGVGDRALLRVEKTNDSDGAPYRGRVIKVIDHARTRLLGIFRALPAGVAG